MFDYEKLSAAMGELDEDTVTAVLHEVMADGGADAPAAMEACQKGMDEVGRLFEEGEYYVGDLIYAGELMTQAVELLKSALVSKTADGGAGAKMVLCTVRNDLHDIGKNIVKAMLEAGGFEVIDLGIDVAPETILEAVKANGVRIVGLSGVLTLAVDSMKETIAALKAAGLTDVRVIIGGAPVSADICARVGADDWAYSPQKTVQVCRAWSGQ